MTLSQLRVLVAVVERGSFTAAAASLGMTQSGASHAVARLEAELGASLLRRGRGAVEVTETGARVLAHAREVLDRSERARSEAGRQAGGPAALRIGTLASPAVHLVPGMLRAFVSAHPDVQVGLAEGTDQEVRRWLLQREVDLGFVVLPAEGLDAVPLIGDEIVAVVPAGHRLAGRSAVQARHLAPEPFVMSTGGCEPLIRAIFAANGLSPRVAMRIREVPTILALVAGGFGVTIVPTLSLPSPLPPDLRAVPMAPRVRRQLALAACSRAHCSPAASAFLSTAVGWLEERGRSAWSAGATSQRPCHPK